MKIWKFGNLISALKMAAPVNGKPCKWIKNILLEKALSYSCHYKPQFVSFRPKYLKMALIQYFIFVLKTLQQGELHQVSNFLPSLT